MQSIFRINALVVDADVATGISEADNYKFWGFIKAVTNSGIGEGLHCLCE